MSVGAPVPPPPPPPPPPPVSPPGYAFGYRYAGLIERFLAVLIDLVILAVIGLVIAIPLGIFVAIAGLNPAFSPGLFGLLFGPFFLLLYVLWIVYFTFLESARGQTIGKQLLHLKVISATSGQTPDLTHSLVRNILRIIDWLPTLYLLGFIVALVTERKQRVGDLLADTIVVHA